MSSWVAVSLGALDVRQHPELGRDGLEYLVTPVKPALPRFLYGPGARLWRRMVDGAVQDSGLSEDERLIAQEMELIGIASRDPSDVERVYEVKAPWLRSPVHELVYALLGRVAEKLSIDVLFIKGPTLHAQGLRQREHSGDVDCWVAPGDELRLARAMTEWGWTPAISALTGTRVLHSLTLRVVEWGSAVDVHSWFPGMAVDPHTAFEIAREHSELREFAGKTVMTPRPALHAVIYALHEMRPLQGRAPGARETADAANVLRTAGVAAVDVIRRVEAGYALTPALRQAFPDLPIELDAQRVPDDWSWRMQTSTARIYAEALKLIPMRQRPKVLFRILWPTRESLVSGPCADGVESPSLWNLRRRRIWLGLRQLRGPRNG